MSLSFKIAIATDFIAILVALYFVFSDMARDTAPSNGSLIMVTIGFCCWVVASCLLNQSGYKTVASVMAWIPAVPIIGYGLMILLFVIFKPDMR